MGRQSALWGVFVTRFMEALNRFKRRYLSADEAGELLGVSGRQSRQLCVWFEGLEGLRDRRLGRAAPRCADAAELGRMCGLYRDRYGLFSAFYTDRGSHDFLTPEAGGRVDKRLTQVGRALPQLGIRHIPSYSPEARGRMERAFGTLQGRLPQDLRLRRQTAWNAAPPVPAAPSDPAHNALQNGL